MAKGGFRLEKNWRSTGVGDTTHNSPGNHSVAYGKFEITVEGRGGTGNAASGGNFAGNNPSYYAAGNAYYNPPSYTGPTPSGSNPSYFVAGTANYNPPTYTAGNATYNPPTLVNPAIYVAANKGSPATYNPAEYSPGNFAGNNPSYYAAGTYANTNASYYLAGNTNYNPPSYTPPTYAGSNPSYYEAGTATYNPYSPAVAGLPASVMGVTFPGSPTGGSLASFVSATKISRYTTPDNATYPVVAPSGSYITIKTK